MSYVLDLSGAVAGEDLDSIDSNWTLAFGGVVEMDSTATWLELDTAGNDAVYILSGTAYNENHERVDIDCVLGSGGGGDAARIEILVRADASGNRYHVNLRGDGLVEIFRIISETLDATLYSASPGITTDSRTDLTVFVRDNGAGDPVISLLDEDGAVLVSVTDTDANQITAGGDQGIGLIMEEDSGASVGNVRLYGLEASSLQVVRRNDGSVIDDTFVASNGTNLDTFTGWTETLDSITPITVLNNRLIADGGSGDHPSFYIRSGSNPGSTTHVVSWRVWFVSTDADTLSFFMLDGSSNGHAFKWDSATQTWTFARVDNTVTAIIATGADDPPLSTSIQLDYRRDGSRHRFYVDGILVIDVTDATYAGLGNVQLVTSEDVDATRGGHLESYTVGFWTFTASITEALSLGDSAVSEAAKLAAATETLLLDDGATGTVTPGGTLTGAFTEALLLDDSASGLQALFASFTEALSLGDAASGSSLQALTGAFTEALLLDDSAAGAQALEAAFTEALLIADAVLAELDVGPLFTVDGNEVLVAPDGLNKRRTRRFTDVRGGTGTLLSTHTSQRGYVREWDVTTIPMDHGEAIALEDVLRALGPRTFAGDLLPGSVDGFLQGDIERVEEATLDRLALRFTFREEGG